jgi:3-carboxy-cis,cis-muconate cycloisomerase
MLNWALTQNCFSDLAMRRIWSESATISAWIRVEQTLAGVQSNAGLIPEEAAKAIGALSIADLDQDQMREDMVLVGRPIVNLVKQMQHFVGPEFAAYVHYNSTTQDVMDTAMSMQMKAGLEDVRGCVARLTGELDRLIEKHGSIRMMGRTNGQYAVPMRLATKLQVWRSELVRRDSALKDAAKRGLFVQIGGPLGDLAKYGGVSGTTVKTGVAQALGLGIADPHWQNARDGVSDIVTALGALCATLCKLAHNVNLLSSSDIGELSENYVNGMGASSSMRHKRNQRASEFAEAVARLGRQRSEQIGELTLHQHERSGGVWIGEWLVVPEVFLLTSGALAWSEQMLCGLHVNTGMMRDHIALVEQSSTDTTP